MTGPIGNVSVSVTPDARGFIANLQGQILPGAGSAGDEFARKYTDGLAAKVAAAIKQGLVAGGGGAGTQGRQAGSAFADQFTAIVKGKLDAAARSLGPRIKVDADTDPALVQMEALRKSILTTEAHLRIGRIDDTAALAQIDDLKAQLDELAAKTPNVRVRVDATAAAAQLAALQAQIKGVEDEADKAGSSAAFKPLLDGALLLGPALIPAAGAIAGIAAGVGGLALTGVLAFKGIQTELKGSSVAGQALNAQLTQLKSGVAVLEQTAGQAALPGFQKILQSVHDELPNLNSDLRSLGGILGDVGSNLVTGLINGFNTFMPLIQKGAGYVDDLSQRFTAWASGPGGSQFAATLTSDFDQFVPALENIVGAVTHVVAAFAPIGSVVLLAIDGVATAIKAIPLPILTGIAAALIATRLAALGFSVVPAVFKSVELAILDVRTASTLADLSLSTMLGPIGLVAAGIAALTFGLLGHKKAQIDDNAAVADFTQLLEASNGAIDQSVLAGTAKKASDDGAFASANKLGISTKLVTDAIANQGSAQGDLSKQIDAVANSVKTVSGPNGVYTTYVATGKQATLAQINLASTAKTLQGQVKSLSGDFASGVQSQLNYANATATVGVAVGTTADQLGTFGKSLGLSASTAQTYAGMVGITAVDSNGDFAQSNAAVSFALSQVSDAYDNATQTGSAYLAAEQTFSQSAGTAADRGAFLAATLKAANGDNLNYATSMVGAADANQQLVTALAATDKNGTTAFAQFVNLKTGAIDFTNAGAQPMIQALGGLQTASLNAASAAYQHYVAIGQGSTAADQAYTQYVNQTQGALIDEAEHFGATAAQAKLFADQYFGLSNAPNIKKQIEAIGADPMLDILKTINSTLRIMAGLDPAPTAHLIDHVSSAADIVNRKLASIQQNIPVTVTVSVLPGVNATGQFSGAFSSLNVFAKADGGPIAGPGTGTSDSILARVSNGEYIVRASQAQKHMALLDSINTPGFAAGGPVNPFGGVNYSPPSSSAGATAAAAAAKTSAAAATKAQAAAVAAQKKAEAAAAAAAKKAAALSQAQANIKFKIDTSDFAKLVQGLAGPTAALGTITRTLLTDVRNATQKGLGGSSTVNTIADENARLLALSRARVTVAAKLAAANTALVAAQKKVSDESATVSGAITGGFNISTAGQFGGAYSTSTSIVADLSQQVAAAKAFQANITKLTKSGLNKTDIQSLAEGGVSSSGMSAAALAAASPQQIAQINALQAQLTSIGGTLGNTVGNSLYGAGVQAAQGLVNGLASQQKTLAGQMTKLADVMVAQIKHDLQIHSPSQVMHDVGGFIAQGMANGIDAHRAKVVAASSRLSMAAIPSDLAGQSRMARVEQHFHAAGLDEDALAAKSARHILAATV